MACSEFGAVSVAVSGVTGATAASRYAGGTATGAPDTGTFCLGDWVIAQDGALWICTDPGPPAVWVSAAVAAAGVALLTGAAFTGNVSVGGAGHGLAVAEGADAKQGVAVLGAGGTKDVSNTSVTADSRIFLTVQVPGGTVGSPYVSALTASSGFTISSTSAADTSTVAYEIIEPG